MMHDDVVITPSDRAGTIWIEIEHVRVHRKKRSDAEAAAMTTRGPPRVLTTLIPVNGISRQSVQHAIVLVFMPSSKVDGRSES